ncbi:MAG: BON domain-containing protein [Kofleriaceae bacterium]
MANHNGRTTHRADEEHGYQDPRDQRDRAHGRDDFRGLDRAGGDKSQPPGENSFGDRYRAGSSGWGEGGRDPWAERDRNMYGDRDEGNARGAGGSMERGMMGSDTPRGSGYGYDDGNAQRGQSGSQAGNMYGNDSRQRDQGGNRGHWGDFDRGGQSSNARPARSPDDPMARNDRQAGQNREGGGYGSSSSGPRDYGEQRWDQMRGPHAGKGPQGFQRSDERIQEMIHEALTDHEHLDASQITVEVKQGEVTLTGTVEDRQAKRLAEDVVERCKGVNDVQNQLRVHPHQAQASSTQNDKKSRPS